MEILGLHWIIWVVLVVYFSGMLALGWWSRKLASTSEGYLLGNRKFGVWMMVMHAFGAGTSPIDATGAISKTTESGASGIWVSWMWIFGTPFYWLIAPIIRRMRCLTMADLFQERFGKTAAVLYTIVASAGMIVFFGGVQLATVRTVQGMMGAEAIATAGEIDWWFYGILIATTLTFALYGYWGGIVAAIRTDMVQGLMIIALSFLAIPAALNYQQLGGMSGMREVLTAASTPDTKYLNLFAGSFSLSTVILLCINAPLVALSFPHLMSVCAAGKTEWEGRMGFAGGNLLKRVCTIGWSILGLCWLAHLIKSGSAINPDAAFGDAIHELLPVALEGLMLACIMAASMSSGDAFQVTVAGLYTQAIHRNYINPKVTDDGALRVTKLAGLVLVLASLGAAIAMQNSVVNMVLTYFNILGIIGIANCMGILWRRMNTGGVWGVVLLGTSAFVLVRIDATYQPLLKLIPTADVMKIGLPILASVVGGVIGSLLTAPPDPQVIENFFRKIYVPIGEEEKLELPLDEVVPPSRRLLTAGGLFIVKPSTQSWVGFLAMFALCGACLAIMLWLLQV